MALTDMREAFLGVAGPEGQAEAERRQGELETRTGQEGILGQAQSDAETRADVTFDQLRQAGFLGLADQLNRTRRQIAFDTARRGTLGGSRSIERTQEAEDAFRQGAMQNILGAQQGAQQQLQGEMAGIFGAQQQVAAGAPFLSVLRQQELEGIQRQGGVATSDFEVGQIGGQIRNQLDAQRAQNIQQAFGAASAGIEGMTMDTQNQNFLNQLRQIYGVGAQPAAQQQPMGPAYVPNPTSQPLSFGHQAIPPV